MTGSHAKLDAWERTRELDLRALALLPNCATLQEAYQRAMREIAVENRA